MSELKGFHEVRFPTDIALGSAGGPQRRTEIVTLASGHEQRNTRWSRSRRRYNAGYGIKTLDDLHEVISFFEQRRGRLYGFRFRDPMDHKSSRPGQPVSPTDQKIGTGDSVKTDFQLVKIYGEGEGEWVRPVQKPVAGTLQLAVGGILQIEGADFIVDEAIGAVMFQTGSVPPAGEDIHAGFEFDVPVRFDTDEITVNMTNFMAGDIAAIPLVEILQ